MQSKDQSFTTKLLKLEADFSQWRSEKKFKSEKIPSTLLERVIRLQDDYPDYQVLQVVKLKANQIRNYKSKKQKPDQKKVSNRDFLNLTNQINSNVPTSLQERCVIKFSRSDGSEIKFYSNNFLDKSSLDLLAKVFFKKNK
jgi:hypothetical protein